MAAGTATRFFSFRNDLASRAAALSFTSNLTLMVLKFAVGFLTGSVAVLSDAIDSAEDAIASTFAFLSIRWASQPADEEHPYGHGKAESIAAAAQAVLITGGAGFIIFQAVNRLIEGDAEINTTPGLIALSVTALVNVGVAMYVGRAAKITGSVALHADTRHLWTNVAQALAVVVALALVAITGNSVFDPIFALALAVYLLWTAANVFLSAAGEIMDSSLPEEEQQQIERCLSEHRSNGLRGFHDLRTRKSGRQRYIDVHVMVDPQATVSEAHDLSDEIEAAICECLPGSQITVHMEPDGGQSWATPSPGAHLPDQDSEQNTS
jgi:cation diffusion facilitator family transporter